MRESVVICDNPPDAPETVRVTVPVGAVPLAVSVNVLVPAVLLSALPTWAKSLGGLRSAAVFPLIICAGSGC